MTRNELIEKIREKKSFLCIGLDTDLKKIPKHLLSFHDPVFEFNRQIIDATHELCVAYKINTAFYEANGISGWESLKKTFDYIPKNIFTIADAKRGDIGNTSAMYAEAFFNQNRSGFDFDAVTVAPYMGEDSVTPFLQYKGKWVVLLALTSNKSAEDFQLKAVHETADTIEKFPNSKLQTANPKLTTHNSRLLFEEVLFKSKEWGNKENMIYVAGATRPEMLSDIRKIIPDHFLLVPGIGAQGGSIDEVVKYGMNKDVGLLVNVSRQIIYASAETNFAETSLSAAKGIREQMDKYL